ncbi:MAG TPA: hypothetical protein VFD36_19705 [Kofleriaceae bacterium]|nr:hypothetical protein [Kofleriaceae bacterium]
MRITALSGVLAISMLGGLTTAAHADRSKPVVATRQLAALVDPAKNPAPALTRGDLGLTATTHLVRTPQPDGADPAPPARLERYLTTGDVSEIIAQRGAEIEHCYVDALGAARRGGRLDLMFVIARDGHVVSLDSAAPGVPVVAAHHLHKCLRTAVEALQFPARRNDTTAVVPYYFQRTDAPNAGPQLSCWNPRGCKSE